MGSEILFTFEAVDETLPGSRWQRVFEQRWPHYRQWFLHAGEASLSSYAVCRRELRNHMPELLGTYDHLVELAGGGDLAARMLSMWNPPPYLSGCSQAVWTRGRPLLVRNYDYAPARLEGVILGTSWGDRGVIGMSDCLWGLLDGVNDAGLTASLTFGGRPEVGEGFGIPLILRYVLQTCTDVDDALAVLTRVPVHMSYNVTITDPTGRVFTVFMAPDRPSEVTRAAATTNHQGRVEWRPYCEAIRSEERLALLNESLDEHAGVAELTSRLLRDPLYATRFEHGFGTLYTAVIRPDERSITYHWPGHDPWIHRLDQPVDGGITVTLHSRDRVADHA